MTHNKYSTQDVTIVNRHTQLECKRLNNVHLWCESGDPRKAVILSSKGRHLGRLHSDFKTDDKPYKGCELVFFKKVYLFSQCIVDSYNMRMYNNVYNGRILRALMERKDTRFLLVNE